MRRYRLGLLVAAFVAVVGLTVAVPAFARHDRQAGGAITVVAGKPSEFRFTLSKSSITKGAVTFTITDKGALSHDFSIAGKKSKLVAKGKSVTLKVVFTKAGKYPYKCTVPGHAAAGMKGTFTVK